MGSPILGNIRFIVVDNGEFFTQDIDILRNISLTEKTPDKDDISLNIGTKFSIEGIGLVEIINISTKFRYEDADHRSYGVNMNGLGDEYPWNSLTTYRLKRIP